MKSRAEKAIKAYEKADEQLKRIQAAATVVDEKPLALPIEAPPSVIDGWMCSPCSQGHHQDCERGTCICLCAQEAAPV